VRLGDRPYVELFQALFPWANIRADEEFYYDYDHELFVEACGMWDSEEKRYIGYSQDFHEWRSQFADVRPFEVTSGEVAKFRLELALNELGRAFLLVDEYASGQFSGEICQRPKPSGIPSSAEIYAASIRPQMSAR